MFALIARSLERGHDAFVLRAMAKAWSPIAALSLVRPGCVRGVPVVCVGGSTIGGSGKTRVAIACAQAIEGSVLVGHAYRGAVGAARVVRPDDDLGLVGDEALVCARAGVKVVVGPTRQAAIDHAVAIGASALVIDGPLRIAQGTTLAVLAVDETHPWGSGRVLPAGDLRAPVAALEAASDFVVPVSAVPSNLDEVPEGASLFTAMARPDRLIEALTRHGRAPKVVLSVADHANLARARAEAFAGDWIATEKCALHFPGSAKILRSSFVLPHEVRAALATL